MVNVNPYLNFNGNCEEAFNFYKTVFGGEFAYFGRFDEMPESEDYQVSEEEKSLVMHVSLPIGDGQVIMGSDTSKSAGETQFGNNISISIGTDNQQHADEVFLKLSNGGEITMPIGDTFWGSYFGMVKDKFGVNWMVSYDKNFEGH